MTETALLQGRGKRFARGKQSQRGKGRLVEQTHWKAVQIGGGRLL